VYGCRAYPLKYNLPRTRKLEPRAHIGYLVGYQSTNIFRVYIPSEKKVIRTRDVTFNEQLLYDDGQPDLANLLRKRADQILDVIDVSNVDKTFQEELDETSDEDDETLDEIQVDIGGSRQADSGGNQELGLQDDDVISPQTSKDDFLPSLPTPDETPEPQLIPTNQGSSSSSALSTRRRPHYVYEPVEEASPKDKDGAAVKEDNIIKGKRSRKPPAERYEAYLTHLKEVDSFKALQAAFHSGLKHHRKIHRDELPPPPKNWKELIRHQYKAEFLAAATKEYTDLDNRGTFEVVDKTLNTVTIPTTWVFTYKTDTDGYLTKFKARLCVRGDLQDSVHKDTYAATLAAKVFRALAAMIAAFDLDIWQCDAVNAFTNSLIDEIIYINCPDGFAIKGKCLLLRRALYGLRRSPLLWHNDFSKELTKLGLKPVGGEPCLYYNDWLIVFFYVDDICAVCTKENQPKLLGFKDALMKKYEMKDLGELSWFLGIRVLRDRSQRKLWLCQDSYIEKIANTFHLTDMRSVSTPMSTDELLPSPEEASKQDIYVYQRMIGSLLYATCITRPDAARALSKLSEFLRNPSPLHDAAARRVIAYLYQTRTLAIEYSGQNVGSQAFTGASDAAFGDDLISRRSTEGYLFTLFGGAIDWHSTKQTSVTKSSTEAELTALSHAGTESIWWSRFFKEIGMSFDDRQTIYCDNLQTIRLLTKHGPELSTKLRHVDIHHHWLRQEVRDNRIKINWTPTAAMVADGLTKALPKQKHETFVHQLNLVDIKDRI
jgi:hypothetical protein